MIGRRSAQIIEIVEPVEVCQIDIALSSEAVFDRYPWPFRIFSLVVTALP